MRSSQTPYQLSFSSNQITAGHSAPGIFHQCPVKKGSPKQENNNTTHTHTLSDVNVWAKWVEILRFRFSFRCDVIGKHNRSIHMIFQLFHKLIENMIKKEIFLNSIFHFNLEPCNLKIYISKKKNNNKNEIPYSASRGASVSLWPPGRNVRGQTS